MYDILNQPTNKNEFSILSDLKYNNSRHNYPTRNKTIIIGKYSPLQERKISTICAKSWNDLSNDIKSIVNRNVFKNTLKTILINKYA